MCCVSLRVCFTYNITSFIIIHVPRDVVSCYFLVDEYHSAVLGTRFSPFISGQGVPEVHLHFGNGFGAKINVPMQVSLAQNGKYFLCQKELQTK